MEDLDEMISLGLDSEAVAVEVAWSPPGLSSMHDCLLAVLDSHHHVSIWQSTGIGNDNWSHVISLKAAFNSRYVIFRTCYLSCRF